LNSSSYATYGTQNHTPDPPLAPAEVHQVVTPSATPPDRSIPDGSPQGDTESHRGSATQAKPDCSAHSPKAPPFFLEHTDILLNRLLGNKPIGKGRSTLSDPMRPIGASRGRKPRRSRSGLAPPQGILELARAVHIKPAQLNSSIECDRETFLLRRRRTARVTEICGIGVLSSLAR
jgi:hypothetical protein